MLIYIIDGFNLAHKVPALKQSTSPYYDVVHYIKQRRLTGSHNNKVIIVFDGHGSLDSAREKEFEVIFSREESADNVIKHMLQKMKNKSQVLVVSDDREIQNYTKRERANSVRIADFLKIKKQRERGESGEDKEISYPLQREITDELRKIWLKE